MAQTFLRVVVDGFHADDFDFFGALQRKPLADQQEFADFVAALVDAEVNAANGVFWSVAIIGHSDRYDVAGALIEERRERELNASRQRMESAGNFLLTEIGNGLSAAGLTAPTTVEDPTNVGICLAAAGAADLVHPTPASEAERQENRRVKFLAISFSSQALAFDFGEQLDRSVA